MSDIERVWALVPLKAPGRSKTRLSPILDADECAVLSQAMAWDLLSALAGVAQLRGIALVGQDIWVRDLAREKGCLFIPEPEKADLNSSLEFAAASLVEHGATLVVIVPGDLPCVTATDIEQLLNRHRNGITLCVAEQDGGTNALVCGLPVTIPFQFGYRSAEAHSATAKARGIPLQRLELPAFGRDIDTPDDLSWLVQQAGCGSGETYRFLDRAGLRYRLGHSPVRATL